MHTLLFVKSYACTLTCYTFTLTNSDQLHIYIGSHTSFFFALSNVGRSMSEPTRELECTETKAPDDRHDPEGAQATTRNPASRSPMCTPPIRRMVSVHKGSPREAIPRTATPSNLVDGAAPAIAALHTPTAPGRCQSHGGRAVMGISTG